MNPIQAELITIGAELLKGSTLNTNARFLGEGMTRLGFSVRCQTSCPDEIPLIAEKLRLALTRTEVVVLTGGLGPTPDDLTREAVAQFFAVPLEFSTSQYSQIKKYYQKAGKKVPAMVKREALYPQNAVPLINRYGIALGFYIWESGQLIIVLPGVPSEMEKMFEELVGPLLKRCFPGIRVVPQLTARFVGLSETTVMKKLGKDFFDCPFNFGIYPDPNEVTVRIDADSKTVIQKLMRKIRRRLGRYAYTYREESLTEVIGRLLLRKQLTLAVAESCTGGLLASEITQIPGASRYFKGAVTAYANEVKKWLGVSGQLIKSRGAVSKEVAVALAKSVRIAMKSTYGIGITGIAGPGGGSPRKPTGLVYIALASPKAAFVEAHEFWGNRRQVQTKAVRKALQYLWEEIH